MMLVFIVLHERYYVATSENALNTPRRVLRISKRVSVSTASVLVPVSCKTRIFVRPGFDSQAVQTSFVWVLDRVQISICFHHLLNKCIDYQSCTQLHRGRLILRVMYGPL